MGKRLIEKVTLKVKATKVMPVAWSVTVTLIVTESDTDSDKENDTEIDIER